MIQQFFCAIGRCLACKTTSDATGIWGECIRCGKRHGFVSSAELRAAADYEVRRKRLFPEGERSR